MFWSSIEKYGSVLAPVDKMSGIVITSISLRVSMDTEVYTEITRGMF